MKKKTIRTSAKPRRLIWVAVILLALVVFGRVFRFGAFSQTPRQGQQGIELPKINPGDIIIKHSAFTLCYDEEHEQPRWVAYELTDQELVKNAKRQNNFRPDTKVPTGSATPEDYKGSGYDRGHLAPAADMAFSLQAMSESFYMSNMSPQAPDFNRGIWNDLEETVRRWAKKEGALYIVTAGVLEKDLPKIGKNGVSVPRYYYKAILDLDGEPKGIAFVLRNEGSKQPLRSFAVSIDSLEKLTGIDFFHLLEDDLEEKLESGVNPSQWGL